MQNIGSIFSFRDRYRILHLNWFAFFISFVVWFSLAPFATTIGRELHLTLPQLKVLAICNLALTIPARILIGIVLDRYGSRLTFGALLIFAVVPCWLTATAQDFDRLVWSSLINSIMGAGFVAGVRMVAEWFPAKEMGLAQGIYGGWGNFGAAAAGFCLPMLAVTISYFTGGLPNWRIAIAIVGVATAIYGSIYLRYAQDTPPGKVFERPERHGGLEVTSQRSFWAITLLDLGLLVSLGLLTYPLVQGNIHFLNTVEVVSIWVFLGLMYAFQFYKAWQVNREVVGSLDPFSSEFLHPSRQYSPSQRYQVRQIALLDFTYWTNFGSQIAVLSILPAWFEQTFGLNPVIASLVATAYPVLNLVSRPSGGLLSDRLGSRKWTMTVITLGIGISYLLMGTLDARSNLTVAIGITMFCAYFVQAGAGATFSIVPLIRKSATGQIAGSVGAYGNAGGVVYLLIYSLSNAQTLFYSMGVAALICASLCALFLKEPHSSAETAAAVTNIPDRAMELNGIQSHAQIEAAKSLPIPLLEASDYLQLLHREQSLPESQLQQRLVEIYRDYRRTNTYWQKEDELIYGAKVAWRNSSRCIGRIFWETLNVRDLRSLATATEVFEAIVEHIQISTNGGNIRSTISIFAPELPDGSGVRIWNYQLMRYAGYRQADGTIVGDPAQIEFTEICQRLGWKGQGTRFDMLPLIVQMPRQDPQWFDIPKEVVMEVPISHPEYPWFAELGLKWLALPAVSDWRLEIGGISYPCAPFSGWYMSAEIGARNFGEVSRYNQLPIIAERMGLNTRSKLSLWKDRALIELNRAVLHSYTACGVTIVDHHTASAQFMRHLQLEQKAGRIVPADWGRIVPPLSASTMQVFHQEMQDVCLKPNFFPQPSPWQHKVAAEPAVHSSSPQQCPFSHGDRQK